MNAKPIFASRSATVTVTAATLATVAAFTILWSVVTLFQGAPQAALAQAPAPDSRLHS